MMDFGAIQCTPTSPKCVLCPLQESCEAFRSGRVGELPVKEKKLTIQTRRFTYMYIRCQGKTAIRKRAAGDIWQGLWEPVLAEGCGMLAGAKLLRKDVKHVLTHRILLADFYLLETEAFPALPEGYIWIDETELDKYAVPRLIELLHEAVFSNPHK
jgi:A/G-specific adenine glycosylase